MNYKKFVLLVAIIGISGLWFFTARPHADPFFGKKIDELLALMPKKDREYLDFFFQTLVRKYCLGYVLIGEKPVSLGVITTKMNPFICLWETEKITSEFQPTTFQKFCWYFQQAVSSERRKLKKAYNVWEKYKKYFPISHFTFSYEKKNHCGADYLTIIVLNNEKFAQVINERKSDFESILGREVIGETMLEEVKSKKLFSDIFENHDGLIGIVLGYGRNNSLLFYQKYRLFSGEERQKFCEKNHLSLGNEELGFAWTEDEFMALSQKFDLPMFRADPLSTETQNLRKKYLEAKKLLEEQYRGKDFLETTLKLLTS